jgi:prolyl oligopeptidase PreP (S9A serine peptidase family)
MCLWGLVALLAGCTHEPPAPVKVENTTTIVATVESIDLERRLVALRGDNGEVTTVEVTPDVRNLDQVQPGDKVVVQYYSALAAELKPKGESPTIGAVDTAGDVVTAEPGEKPSAAVGRTVKTTVVIDAVDKASNTVAFRGPNGMLRSVQVQDPEARKFVASLRKGDEVEMTYTEALAISVEPTS